jgi:NADPH:quinone reductase-like Zn-dependent oxidoreductase
MHTQHNEKDMIATMHAIRQDQLGGTQVLKLTTVPIPRRGMGEILIRVRAAGVNPVDVMAQQSGVFIGVPPLMLG